jgi:hypothetical protein
VDTCASVTSLLLGCDGTDLLSATINPGARRAPLRKRNQPWPALTPETVSTDHAG